MDKTEWIKRVRREVLISLKMIYPVALQAEALFRSLLNVFPTLEWTDFAKDLAYLAEKGYVQRVIDDREKGSERLTPARHRWYRLTDDGVEIADGCRRDSALEV